MIKKLKIENGLAKKSLVISAPWSRPTALGTCFFLAALIMACSSNTKPGTIMQPKTLQLASQTLSYYESAGGGDSVFLIHGNSSSGRAFQHQLEGEFGQKYHVIAPDLPGHGNSASGADMSAYNLPNYAATVVAAAKALHMEDAVFVGWSLGGHITLQAQGALPNAAGLVIFGTPPLASPPAMDEAFLPNPAMGAGFKADVSQDEATAFATAFFAPNTSADIAPFVTDILNTDGDARAGLAASITPGSDLYESHQDEVQIVRNMKVPLAVLHGQQDQLVNARYISALNMPSLWRNAVQVIPNAGHAPQWEQAEKFNALLGAFIDEVNR